MTPAEASRQFYRWLESPEGKAAQESYERVARDLHVLLERSRDIPWDVLIEPYLVPRG